MNVFEEAMAYSIDGGWETADDISMALVTDATVPTDADTTPALGDYTEVTAGGNYSAGGISLGTLGSIITESGGIVTVDSATNPTWAVDGANPTNAFYAIIYNSTQAGDPAWGWINLNGGVAVNMSTTPLTVTLHANGLFRITKA